MAKRPTSGTGRSRRGAALSAALSSREVPQILNGVLDRIDEDRKEEASLEAKRSRAESEMLAADLERLIGRYGENHPRVRKVQTVQASLERQSELAEATVRRIETFQPPARSGWTASGRVWDEGGAPLAGVEVGFIGPEGSQAGLEPTKTDEEGEFYATYSADIVKRLVETKAQLSLIVRKGRTVLHQDPSRFHVQPNAIRQFRVRIAKKPGDQGKR